MPITNRPSLPDLITQVTQQLAINLQGQDPTIARMVIGVVGMTLAQALSLEYGYAANFPAQFFIATATGGYLDDRGDPYAIYRQPGAYALGSASVTGIPFSTLAADSVAQTLDGSVSVNIPVAVTLDSSGNGVALVSALAVGVAGNLAAGTTLSLVVGSPGINATLTVLPATTGSAIGLQGGLGVQADAVYRTAILQRTQFSPQGGAAPDYVGWVKQSLGVTRAWTYPLLYGLGTVSVAAVYDGRAPGSIIPTTGDLAAQTATLDGLVPVVGTVSVFALAEDAVAVTLTSLTALPGTSQATALANATASLAGLFAAATPGGAAAGDGIISGVTPGTIPLASIYDAIAQSAGVGTFDLSAPAADYAAATGHLPVLGAVTLT